MKRVILSCTRFFVYLTIIPPGILLWLTILHHDKGPTFIKFFPLEILLGAVILFILLYFARFVTVGRGEARIVGLFSSRDKAMIKEGRTLSLTLYGRKRLLVEVSGPDTAGYDDIPWLTDSGKPRDINLFRERTIGDARHLKKVLKLFGVCREALKKIWETEEALTLTDGGLFIRVEPFPEENRFAVHLKFLTDPLLPQNKQSVPGEHTQANQSNP